MTNYDNLRDTSATLTAGGLLFAGAAFFIEVFGFEAGDNPPDILTMVEIGGLTVAAIGVLGLTAYGILRPKQNDEDDHWR